MSGRGTKHGLAPSERHLEDYIWAHPEALGIRDWPGGDSAPLYQMFRRQFWVPSGRIDILGADWQLCAFELKKGALTANSLAQLLRYMYELKTAIFHVLNDMAGDRTTLAWLDKSFKGDNFDLDELVRGVLIGHSYEDENLLIACDACKVDVYLYQFDGVGYSFERPCFARQINSHLYVQSLNAMLSGPLPHILRSFYQPEIDTREAHAIKSHNAAFSAASTAEQFVEELIGGEI